MPELHTFVRMFMYKRDCQINNCEILLESSAFSVYKTKVNHTHASQRQMFSKVLKYEKYYLIFIYNLLDAMVFSHIYLISMAHSVRIILQPTFCHVFSTIFCNRAVIDYIF